MSIHRALSNGWWNKLKPTNTATELKVDKFPSIYVNSETIPTKYIQKSNQLSLVSNNNYLNDKGFGDQYKMEKDEVKRVLSASLPSRTEGELVDVGSKSDEPHFSGGGKPPPNLPTPETVTASHPPETVTVSHPPYQDVDGVPDYLERVRNPPFDNSTVNVVDATGRVKDALSDPVLIGHVDKLYEDLKTGVKITKKTGGRGAGGGRGVELTFNGKKLDDLTPADAPALQSALAKLKKADDDASGKVARRIHSDYRKLDSAVRGLIATASVGGYLASKTSNMSTDGKAVLEEAVTEAKKELLEKTTKAPKPAPKSAMKRKTATEIAIETGGIIAEQAEGVNDMFNTALEELRRIKASKEAKREAREALQRAMAEAEKDVSEGEEDDGESSGSDDEPKAGGGGATVAKTVASEPAEGVAPVADKKVPDISIVDTNWMTGKHRSTLLRLASSIDIDKPEQYEKAGLKKKILLRKAEILKLRLTKPEAYKTVASPKEVVSSSSKRASKSGGGGGGKTITLDV